MVLGALMLVVLPAASAHPIKPLTMEVVSDLVFPEEPDVPHWAGTITGDVAGTIRLDVSSSAFPGSTQHWDEVNVITTDGDATITVESKGVWNFATLKFRTIGIVVDATGEYEYLIGARAHGMGYTDSAVPPIRAEMTLQFN
jgi:hypothetical protein